MKPMKSRGRFVRHAPCPSCTSSDALAIYQQDDGSQDATCYSCGHYLDVYLSQSDQSNDGRGEVKQMLNPEMIMRCPKHTAEERKLRFEVVERYGMRTLLNGADGRTPVAHCFPYYHTQSDVAFKKRSLQDKHHTIIGNGRDLPFFGQHLFEAGGKRLYITEGEYDAMSLWQVLKDLAGLGYKHLEPSVVSLPNGTKSVAGVFDRQASFLEKFEEIVLVFDQDTEGQKAVETACSILPPHKVKVAKFSEKDASDMLVAGKLEELKWSVLTKAKPYIPSGIATVNDLYEQATTEPTVGRPWAWPTLTKLTYGRNPGIFLVGAGVGVGKTEFFHEHAGFILREEGKPVGMFLFEEAPARTLRILAGKMIGKATHLPDNPVPQEEYLAGLDRLRNPINLVYTFDHKWDRTWESIYTQMKHVAVANDVKDIFLDPLTALVSHEENTDRALHSIMDDLAILTQDPYNCCIYVSSHLNEPPRDRVPHEEGGRVKESQFTGSRAMIRYASYVFGLERNKQAEDPIERNTTTVRVLKDREYGSATGETFSLHYDLTSGKYQEMKLEF